MSLLVKDIIQMAQTQLEEGGVSDAKLDAELIFRYVMGVDKMGFFKLWGETLEDNYCERYLDLITIRAGGTPLQYITGEQEFMGFAFRVNGEVLIPRQDTETLVTEAVSVIKEKKRKKYSVLDLGCGSGIIGISIAKLCENVRVTASDISRGAVETSRQNASLLGIDRNMSFVCGDVFVPFKRRFRPKLFDMIVSNPPYIRSCVIETLQTEIKNHEPIIALDGGFDGLAYYRKIIPKAHMFLKKDGVLVLEIGYDQAAAVSEIAQEYGSFGNFRVKKDLAGNDRVIVLEM